MKYAALTLMGLLLFGFAHNTDSQKRDTIKPPTQQVADQPEIYAVYRLKEINDSATLATKKQDVEQVKQSWLTFRSLSRRLIAYTNRLKQEYKEQVVRDTVVEYIILDDPSELKPPGQIDPPHVEAAEKKESWIKRLFKNIF
ncbi:hypothetical protein ABDK00_014000 [Niabella insulamsoli]|uniref:hypothetical protein n=1 Tax=Niabella insulamsoli TaxID=3144874 RepID=UPI0031FD1B74